MRILYRNVELQYKYVCLRRTLLRVVQSQVQVRELNSRLE
jgi:hypothetical protein